MQEKEEVMKAKIFIGLIGIIIVFLTAQISGAESMKVDLLSVSAVTHGTMNSDTNCSSVLHDGSLLQNRYEFEAHEVGGECTVMQTFELASSSDIEASLGIEMGPLADFPVYLATEEKIGTGILRTREQNQEVNQVEKFSGAAGSGLGVTETSHISRSWTDNGDVVHSVESEGKGKIKAGMVGYYFLYQGPAHDDQGDEEGGLHPQLCPWRYADEVELVELANQSFEYHITHRGEYSYEFMGEIGPPPAYSP